MEKISINLSNMSKPAPKGYRKFENAYTLILAPALIAVIQSWGLSDLQANRAMIILTFSVAVVKFLGMILANGQQYTESEDDIDSLSYPMQHGNGSGNNLPRFENPPPPPPPPSRPEFPADRSTQNMDTV